jgi:aryl-alcohol dehydrogenase
LGARRRLARNRSELRDRRFPGESWIFETVVQGSSVPQSFLAQLIQLYCKGQFPIDKLIKDYRLADINQRFADSADGTTIKPVVVF